MGRYLNSNADGFGKIVNSEIYVDKTSMLSYTNQVLNTMQGYLCVSRPRRFGKSTAANMLTAYYSCGCDSKALFSGFKIAKDKDFGDLLVEDYNLRKFLKKQLYSAGIPKIEIERDATKVRVNIHCSKPGMVIGKGGAEIDKLRAQCEKLLKKPVLLNIIEVKSPDMNAQLVAENIAAQLEKRISFRRAMKQSIGRAMKFGAKGIKVQVSGRLGGAEIARTEHYHEGTIPLQTLRADIDYGFAEAATTYGRLGVKVWLYKGEVLGDARAQKNEPERKENRRPRERRAPKREGGQK